MARPGGRIMLTLATRKMGLAASFVILTSTIAACSPEPPAVMKALPPLTIETWAPQDLATNVQDWDRAAAKIASSLVANGLLPELRQPGTTPSERFFLHAENGSPFLKQLRGALETDITMRGGTVTDFPAGAVTIDLGVDIVEWGSRLSAQPGLLRREAVWQAKVMSGNQIALSIREPFYIFPSDEPLYQTGLMPDEALAMSARPLRYTTQ
jgi:hypothetical protein